MKLIGIAGKKRSGKNTAADILTQFGGYSQFSFANPLKAMLETLLHQLNIDPDTRYKMLHGDLKEMPCPQLCGKSTRHALQTLGTEWGRDCIDRDFWVTACIQRAKLVPKAVITDVRFYNEAQGIREAGGIIIMLERNESLKQQDDHPSEDMDFVGDYVIFNNSSVARLAYELQQIEMDL